MKSSTVEENKPPLIKSFSRRVGRKLTKSRKNDLTEHLPNLAVEVIDGMMLNPTQLFKDPMEGFELEIGFGTGEHLVARALDNREIGYIGCEPFLNGVAKAVQLAKTNGLENLKIYPDDAQHVIGALPAHSLDKIVVLFPDPWPKKRHHVRRIINLVFLNKVAQLLKDCGKLIVATDHEEYATWIREKVAEHGKFILANKDLKQFPIHWHKSKYHLKAENNGLAPFYFEFIMK